MQDAFINYWLKHCVYLKGFIHDPLTLTALFCSWYKDGELLELSHPDYISLMDDHIIIVANAINEGTYTCIVKMKTKVLTTYSWKVRVRFWWRSAQHYGYEFYH